MAKYLLPEEEYTEYQNMKARLKELKEENETLKDRFIISNAKHTDYIIETNEKLAKLREKLKIALNSLNDIATFDNYIVAQLDAQQALQKIEEVDNG